MYFNLLYQIAEIFPKYEKMILESIVEKLVILDADSKFIHRKQVFSNSSKHELYQSFKKRMINRLLDSNEIKMSILIN